MIGLFFWGIRSVTTEVGEEIWMKVWYGLDQQFVYEQKVMEVRVAKIKMIETDDVVTERLVSFMYN